MGTSQDPALSVAASLQLPEEFAREVGRAVVREIARDPEVRQAFIRAIKDDAEALALLQLSDPWPAEWVTVSVFVSTLREWEESAASGAGSKPPLLGITERKVWNRLNERSFNGLQNGVHYSQGEAGTSIFLNPQAFVAWWLRGVRRP